MEIYIIKIENNNIDQSLIESFQKKAISNSRARFVHCYTYFMLDKILDEVYKIKNREIAFENKKPLLKTKEKFFSISHSDEYIALAFSNHNCGIDIEKIKERPFIKIAKRMNFKCDSLEKFYYKWTEFEAKYKLRDDIQSYRNFKYNNYSITAVCTNPMEEFNIIFEYKNKPAYN